jgi:hypothetical protein
VETWLKRGVGQAEAAEADARVREAVERILDDVARPATRPCVSSPPDSTAGTATTTG